MVDSSRNDLGFEWPLVIFLCSTIPVDLSEYETYSMLEYSYVMNSSKSGAYALTSLMQQTQISMSVMIYRFFAISAFIVDDETIRIATEASEIRLYLPCYSLNEVRTVFLQRDHAALNSVLIHFAAEKCPYFIRCGILFPASQRTDQAGHSVFSDSFPSVIQG